MLEKRISLCKSYSPTDEMIINIFCWGVERSLCQGKQKDSSGLSCCQSPSNDALFLLAFSCLSKYLTTPKTYLKCFLQQSDPQAHRACQHLRGVWTQPLSLFSQESMRSVRNPHKHCVPRSWYYKPMSNEWVWLWEVPLFSMDCWYIQCIYGVYLQGITSV